MVNTKLDISICGPLIRSSILTHIHLTMSWSHHRWPPLQQLRTFGDVEELIVKGVNVLREIQWWQTWRRNDGPFEWCLLKQPKNKLVGGWPTPLKNDGLRQLGWLFPIYGKIIQMFQTTNQKSIHIAIGTCPTGYSKKWRISPIYANILLLLSDIIIVINYYYCCCCYFCVMCILYHRLYLYLLVSCCQQKKRWRCCLTNSCHRGLPNSMEASARLASARWFLNMVW